MSFLNNIMSKSAVGALAVGVALALAPLKADASTVSSTGVTGGCVNSLTPGSGLGVIDVLSGAQWNASFSDGEQEGGCFFDLANNSGSVAAVTVAVATVNQNGQNWGFREGTYHTGAVELQSYDSVNGFFPLWSVAEGVFDSESFNFNIAANDSVVFDWLWGEAYASGGALPQINFSVSATPVPLPAGGLLLLTALGGVAALRRKRKAA